MKLFVPNQTGPEEARVALTPAVAKKLAGPAVEVWVESQSGAGAAHADSAYEAAGAKVAAAGAVDLWEQADVVAVVHPPPVDLVRRMKAGALLVGMLAPHRGLELIRVANERSAMAMALEYLPRITRAQGMDVLSSQANLAGYKAVITAAEHCPKIFPLLMTAAGTLQPAKVFVIGAGVAGLQAIATAKRLGAVVSAYDVRAAVKEQVQSVGARFVELPLDTSAAQGSGGYAGEQSAEQQRRQQELMSQVVTESDVVITTAAVPGKPAPKLIPADVVARMGSGSVIVDLAAETGGNCELTEPGKVVRKHGVTIVGTTNIPSTVAVHASQVYATNLLNLFKLLLTKEGELKVDPADEIVAGVLLCRDGQVVHPKLKEVLSAES